MPRAHTYEEVKKVFEKRNYKLLSTKYTNCKIKLYYECERGHRHGITFSDFINGHGCPFCVGQGKPLITEIRDYFSRFDYKLLSTKYKNAHSKLEYECDKGHLRSMRWNDFQQGCRCPTCADNLHSVNYSGKNNPNWKGGVSQNKLNLPLYVTYAHQLEKYQPVHKITQNNLELLGVECTYCNKVFVPKRNDVSGRIHSIKNPYVVGIGEKNLYCSKECKKSCPTYGQQKYTKDRKPYRSDIRPDQKQWAKMVKERDNYTCQKCGTEEGRLYAHHIDPVINNPIESVDLDNGKTLCKSCHKEVHKVKGCTLYELRCKEN